MWEAKIFAGNRFTVRAAFAEQYDACEQADEWASAGNEVWVTYDGKLDRVLKG